MSEESTLRKLKPRVLVVLELDGKVVVDEELADILRGIRSTGSLIKTARSLGKPYSRAWEKVARAERLLGLKLVEARRGGYKRGGTRLTKAGEEVLRIYEDYRERLGAHVSKKVLTGKMPDLVVIGSHDPLLELLVGRVKTKMGLDVEVSWVGSAGGLAALMTGDADIAGVHLYDEESGEYNEPFLDRYWLRGHVVLVKGYCRELGLVFRPEKPVKSIRDLLSGEYRLANRNLGSGTRHMLEVLLRREGVEPEEAAKVIPGYETEYRTHTEVAEAVARGDADVGLALRVVAEPRGLGFLSVAWERYDLVVSKNSLDKEGVKALLGLLSSPFLKELISRMPGYKEIEK